MNPHQQFKPFARPWKIVVMRRTTKASGSSRDRELDVCANREGLSRLRWFSPGPQAGCRRVLARAQAGAFAPPQSLRWGT
jgi:hypothetical protein